MSSSIPTWVAEAVADFGSSCKEKLAGPGDREAAIRTPLEELLSRFGEHLHVKAVFHDEVRDPERRVRPDYGVSIDGAISGYVEVKAPGGGIDPTGFKGHDLKQWERQKDLPNLLYTNGNEWRLFRDGEPVGEPVRLSGGSLDKAGSKLAASADFEELLTDFLRWKPTPIGSVTTLVKAIAPLTRLLRGEVLEQLASERKAVKEGASEYDQPFLGLAADWRRLLFPTANDEVFADGYAQTVTFALLLARSDGIELDGATLHTVGDELGDHHSLMGRALQLLTDNVANEFKVTLDLLVRVIGAVEWPDVRKGKRDTYLHLYEHFLEEYDPKLRQESGSYYTPIEVVDQMVRLTEEVLIGRLGRQGFGDEKVFTVDPAMGAGTFLQAVIDRAADRIEAQHGPGMVRGLVTDLAKRLIGFELQTGPYAVAELRTTDILRKTGATPPPGGMRLYVTDTLDDPDAPVEQLASGLGAISDSRRQASIVKRDESVTVVIGNPPYRERAEGEGGWVEMGSERGRSKTKHQPSPLDAFRVAGNERYANKLKNLYVYFWRWATWKVFDSLPEDRTGVVCFITTSGYLGGPGFRGMREYLRRTCSEGWIIDLSPEGMRPEVATRVFPGVQQPLAIGIFVRNTDADTDLPAAVHYTAVSGLRAEKYAALNGLAIKNTGDWRDARTDWQSSLTPAAISAWDSFPAMDDLLPWTSPGCTGNRSWPYAPSQTILKERWQQLVGEADPAKKRVLFKETGDRSIDKNISALPGPDTVHQHAALSEESGPPPASIRVGYRSFDRQWIFPDSRVLDRPRPDLWSARSPEQVFVVEQHSQPLSDGPGLILTALIPDLHYFNNRGGRTLPLIHPDGTPNLPPGLLNVLSAEKNTALDHGDVLTYASALVAHPAFTRAFADELSTPGIRVPMTANTKLWQEAIVLGRTVVWLHTYGEAFADDAEERPHADIRFSKGDPRQPLSLKPVTKMPEEMTYDTESQTLKLGTGEWGPVKPAVINYAVGGRNVLKSWFNYRKKEPTGRKTSPLDDIHVEEWPSEWTVELIDLLTVLTRLVELEPAQADLLDRILAGRIITKDELAERGVKWPTTKKDRAPHRSALGSGTAQQPTLGDELG